MTVRTLPAAPGAACPATFTVPVRFVRAFAIVAVPDTVAVPAFVDRVADPTVPADANVAVPAFVANPATPADPTVPAVVDQTAVDVLLEVSTDPAAPGAPAADTFTVPVASARASATVAVPPDDPPETIVAVWIALPVGTQTTSFPIIA